MEGRVDMGGRDLLHAFQGLDPALGLARLGGLGAEALDKGMHVRDLALLAFEVRLLVGQPFGAYMLERTVVARVQRRLLLLDVQYVAAYAVQKIAVM